MHGGGSLLLSALAVSILVLGSGMVFQGTPTNVESGTSITSTAASDSVPDSPSPESQDAGEGTSSPGQIDIIASLTIFVLAIFTTRMPGYL